MRSELDDLELAHLLADRAAEIAFKAWGPGVAHSTKADGSPVTTADLEVGATILDLLATHRPGDGVLSEEHDERGSANGRRWIIDPIDGTVEFISGRRGWATYIALEIDGQLEVGVVGFPADGFRYWAQRDSGTLAGATIDGVRDGPERAVRIDATSVLSDPRCTATPATPGPALDLLLATGRWIEPDRYILVGLLEGRIDVFLSQGGEVWDHAANVIVFEEAGGTFRDPVGGHRLDLRGGTYAGRPRDPSLGPPLDGSYRTEVVRGAHGEHDPR